jgi:hypothetical protein
MSRSSRKVRWLVALAASALAALAVAASPASANIAPTIPGKPVISEITQTTAKACWAPASDSPEHPVAGYDVYDGNAKVGSTTTATCFVLYGLAPSSAHSVTVIGRDSGTPVLSTAASAATAFTTTSLGFIKPTTPGTPVISAITGTTATVRWGPSADDQGVTGYDVYLDGTKRANTTVPTASLTDLLSGKSYSVTVIAKDADGNESVPSAASVFQMPVVDYWPPVPSKPVVSAITANGATACWAVSIDQEVSRYDVYLGAIKVGSTTGGTSTCFKITGLNPSTTYSVAVVALDNGTPALSSAASGATAFTTLPPPPLPIVFGYNLAGSATLKTLAKGSLPLKGTIDAQLTLATGAFTADLALATATAKLTALGFLPVVAQVSLVSTAPVTGTLAGGVLKANAKVRIKLPRVSLAGIQLAGGSGCQAKQISSIDLTSTDAFFNPLDGGTLAGTFAISDLVNCGVLTGIVSPLTAGKGNAIALQLTPNAVPPPS